MNEKVYSHIFFLLGTAALTLPAFYPSAWVLFLCVIIFFSYIYRSSAIQNILFLLPYAAITLIPYIVTLVFPPFVPAEPGFSFPLIVFAGALLLSSTSSMTRGILFGFILSAVFIISSYAGHPLIEEVSFWKDQGRLSGLMKDPNALSLSAFLMLGFLKYQGQRNINFLIVSISLLLGLFSGGRLYILGTALLFLLYLIRTFRLKTVLATLSLASLTVFSLFYLTPKENFPVGIQRVYDTVTLNNIESTLMNRVSFNLVSIRMFSAHPIFGIGSGNYKRELLPFSYSSLGTWSDNANNFYLQLLTEQGIFGFIIFCLCFFRLRKINVSNFDPSLNALIIFALLLLFGPHIEFLEVSFLCGVLFQRSLTGITHTKTTLLFSGFSALCLSCIAIFSTRGVYPYEYNEGFFRWTKDKAVIRIDCRKPLLFSSGREKIINVILWSNDFNIQFPLSGAPKNVEVPCAGRSRLVTVSTEDTFTPPSDNRTLGVKISDGPF